MTSALVPKRTLAMADSQNNTARTRLVVFLAVPLRFDKIAGFRGYVNDIMAWKEPLLHNHITKADGSSGEDYGYPMVQYRVVEGCAALFGLNDGCKLIEDFLNAEGLDARYAEYEDRANERKKISLSHQPQRYHIAQWAALNNANYEEYSNTPFLADRIALLERILTNHLINFCENVGYRFPDKALWVRIVDCSEPQHKKFTSDKGKIPRLAFAISYQTNLVMPNFIGIGKGKSKGFGVQLKGYI